MAINGLDGHADTFDWYAAVAERDEVAGALDGHDGGDAGDGEDVPFLEGVRADEGERGGVREGDVADCEGGAGGAGFAGDGDDVDCGGGG